MKKTKKFLSILLSLLMIISAIPFTAITAFADEEFVIENGVLIKYNGNGGDIVIPDDVTKIGMKVFFDCQALKSVTIPNGVKYIDYDAFARCLNLTDVVLTEGLNIIELSAFGDCSNLTNIVIPKSVTFISNLVFRGCNQLSSITISDNIETFGFNVFDGCSKLRTINYYCDSDLEKVKEILQPYDNGFNYNLVHDMLPATCTASSTCNTCGTTEGKPLGHNWQKATCTEPKTCLRCAEIDGEPNGHNYLEYGIVTTETCTDPAYYEGACTICGDYSDSIPEGEPLGHVFNAKGELVTPATCTTPAVYKLKCIRCSETNGTMSFGKPLGHKFEYRKVIRQNPLIVSAKCTECGFEDDAYEMPPRTYMSDCESYYINEGDTLNGGITLDVTLEGGFAPEDASVYIDDEYYAIEGTSFTLPNCLECVENYRDYDDFYVYLKFKTICEYLPATCTKPETCIYCGATRGEPLGHTWAEATCEAPKTCSECGLIEGNPNGHTWKAATCIAPKTCSECGLTDGKALGHDYSKQGALISEATCTESAVYEAKCIRCDSVSGTMEVGKPNGHTWVKATCIAPKTCSVCSATEGGLGSHDYSIVVNDYVYTHICKYCEHSYNVDKTALVAAIQQAEEYLNDPLLNVKYQEPYITLLRDDRDGGRVWLVDANASQQMVNARTTLIEISITNLITYPKKYSVTVNKIVDGDTVDTENVTVAYGEMFSYFVDLDENQAIYKWTVTVNGKDGKLNTISQAIDYVVNGDIAFNCYIDDSDTKASDTARVVFYDKANRVIKLDYVEVGSSVNMSVEAPKVAFYDFIGWETVSGDPTNVDKSGVSLRATYAPKDIAANKSTIVALGNVKVNGKQTTTEFYDAKITLTGAESYAYCDENGNILQAINGNVIYAPNNSQTIYVCAGTSNKASTSITGYIDENSKLTINAQYYLPSGSSVVEAGIIAINGDKSNTFKSSQQGSSGEYSISLNYGSASGTLNFKSYLTYKDTDGIHTIYSESQAISFGQNA